MTLSVRVLVELCLQSSGSAIERHTLRKLRKPTLVRLQRGRQFAITLLLGSERQVIVSGLSFVRRVRVGRLLAEMHLVARHKIILAFRVLQEDLARGLPKSNCMSAVT